MTLGHFGVSRRAQGYRALTSLAAVWLLGLACLLVTTAKPARADYWHYGVIWGADYVDVSHPGYHTHQNSIGFTLQRLYMPRARNISVVAHCQLGTFSKPYGSIENWTTRISGNEIYVTVPSQFADFLIGLYLFAPYTASQYWQTWPYYAEVWWYGP